MKQYIDRPGTENVKHLDRMIAELSPWLNEFEMDRCVEFLITISGSKFDINPSIEDSKTQMKIILGSDRFDEIVMSWTMSNQKLLTSFGKRKYKSKIDPTDKTLYDGLDPQDDPKDWEAVYV